MDPLFKYEIFPDFYAADKSRWLALNCEMCATTNEEEFTRLLGADPEKVVSVVKTVA